MTAAFARLPLRPRAAVPQRHAGALLRRLRRGDLPAGDARPRRSEVARRPHRRRARRLRIQPAGARSRSASPTPACFRSRSTPTASPTRRGGRRSKSVLREEGWLNFLFVGRIVPNKKIEDHIKLAEHYKRYVDEQYRFIFVGKTDATPRYYAAIQALLERYRMPRGPLHLHRCRCRTRTWRRTTARPASTFRCRSTKASACRCSKRWPRTCRCSPTRRRRCRIRLAARACSLRRRISNTRRSSSGELAYNDTLRTQVIAGQRARLADFGDDRIRKELERLTS